LARAALCSALGVNPAICSSSTASLSAS
jgi:hypothetical protein